MKKALIIFVSILFLFPTVTQGQSIVAKLYMGYDCHKTIRDKKLRGGCELTESAIYSLNFLKKNYVTKKTKRTQKFREYSNGEFLPNQLNDSINYQYSKGKISQSELNRLIILFDSLASISEKDTTATLPKYNYSKWNMETLELNEKELELLQLSIITHQPTFDTSNTINYILRTIQAENEDFLIRSDAMSISIKIQTNNEYYEFWQQYSGRFNCKWNVIKGSVKFELVSPEINTIVYELLPKSFTNKDLLVEFKNLEYLKYMFKPESEYMMFNR